MPILPSKFQSTLVLLQRIKLLKDKGDASKESLAHHELINTTRIEENDSFDGGPPTVSSLVARKSSLPEKIWLSENATVEGKCISKETRVPKVSIKSLSVAGADDDAQSEGEDGREYDSETQLQNTSSTDSQEVHRGFQQSVDGSIPKGSPGQSGSEGSSLSGSNGGQNDRPGGSGGHNPKKRRSGSPLDRTKLSLRFACPYQVYEPQQDCLQHGKRNPGGGCFGISRLRQHLSRRHMLSFRCQTCWRSFDTKAKQAEHVQDANCRPKSRSEEEGFMEPALEAHVDALCGNTGLEEKDRWWELFRLLIPGMSSMDDDSWSRKRLDYPNLPYYIAGNRPSAVPALDFTNFTFPQPPREFNPLESGLEPGTLSQFLVSESYSPVTAPIAESFFSLMPQAPLVPGLESTLNTQSHNYAIGPETTIQPLDLQTVSDDGIASYFSISPRDGSTTTTTPISDHTSTSPGSLRCSSISSAPSASGISAMLMQEEPNSSIYHDAATQLLRQTNQKLRARSQRMETENTELRDANRAARADVSRAEGLVEELLMRAADFAESISVPSSSGAPNSARNLFSDLLEISKLLETAGEKLRKAS
ncbi:hypothetical protein V8F20_008153 [Naviculisporaceae sp. PSN 640]